LVKTYGSQIATSNGRACVSGYTSYWQSPKVVMVVDAPAFAYQTPHWRLRHEFLHLIYWWNWPERRCPNNPWHYVYDYVQHGGECDPFRGQPW